MRKLIYYADATLDGFIAGPQGEIGFFPHSEELLATMSKELPETVPTHVRAAMGLPELPNARFDTVLMGRGTYEPALREGITSPYAHLRQYVFSRTLSIQDPTVTLCADQDPVASVRALKAEEGPDLKDIWLAGGGKLAGALLNEIDELHLKRSPVVAGAGIPLFDGPFNPTAFVPGPTQQFDAGVSMTTFTRQ
jgi:dihydrofolate reductase